MGMISVVKKCTRDIPNSQLTKALILLKTKKKKTEINAQLLDTIEKSIFIFKLPCQYIFIKINLSKHSNKLKFSVFEKIVKYSGKLTHSFH